MASRVPINRSKDTEILPPGKLPNDLLRELLDRYTTGDESVVQGPDTGIDATLISLGGRLLVAKADPVTFLTEDLGHYVVNINANDVACMGGKPRWFMVSLLFPAGTATLGGVEEAFAGIRKTCDELSISFCGGHTEVTDAVTRVVAAGVMMGTPLTGTTFQASRARPGCSIVMTEGVAIEGTSIIARKRRREVKDTWGDEFLERCLEFMLSPGISVVKAAGIASAAQGVMAMHDPTEGGLSAALHEFADASGTGFVVYGESIPVYPETRALCERYGIDPMGIVSSGALLLAVDGDKEAGLLASLDAAGISARVIGRFVGDTRRRKIVEGGKEVDLQRYDRDEILKV